MKYIQPFNQILRKDSPKYGGKAASLGEMLQAGVRVPNGFGISIDAHREFANKEFSKEFKHELDKAFDTLRAKRVAIRSSAVAEDASDASWAGQLETFLNITRGDLEENIRKCWKSVEAEHVKAYAQNKRLEKNDLLVGVAVQAMVESEAAGVMFTVNPVTRDKNELIIEAAYGLGEMVVQGSVTPDRYLVNSKTMAVTKFDIKVKEKMLIYRDGKNVEISVPANIADRNVLWEKEILELAKIGLKIAEHYHEPQDIEWAKAKGKFYIVQSRPITTL